MPEDMSDRMPEDLPVRKCINAMVGIIRSEVIVFFYKLKLFFPYYLGPFLLSYLIYCKFNFHMLGMKKTHEIYIYHHVSGVGFAFYSIPHRLSKNIGWIPASFQDLTPYSGVCKGSSKWKACHCAEVGNNTWRFPEMGTPKSSILVG
jgi:hypothetical protein